MSAKGHSGDHHYVWLESSRPCPRIFEPFDSVNWVRIGRREIWPDYLPTDEHVEAAKAAQDFISAKW